MGSPIGRTWNRSSNDILVPKETFECAAQGLPSRGMESEFQSMFGENKGTEYQLRAYSLLREPGPEPFFVPVVVS